MERIKLGIVNRIKPRHPDRGLICQGSMEELLILSENDLVLV